MRVLLCHGGAVWATHDVYTGLLGGLKAGGHLVWEYALGARLDASHEWLKVLSAKQKAAGGPLADVEPSPADEQHHASEGAIAHALRHEVDWVVVVCGAYFHLDVVELLRRAGLKTAVVFTESPYDDAQQAKAAPYYDAVFTNERTSVDVLREANPHTHYLPAAYDPETHGVDGSWTSEVGPPRCDVVFVGTGFSSRIELLAGVDWSGIDLRLYGYWDDVPKRHPLAPFLHPGLVDNATTGRLYRRARLGLNLYRDFGTLEGEERAQSLNPRAYELAADGVFTLSTPRAEVSERFGPLVPTFSTPKELETLVRHFLWNEAARRDAATGLPARVEQDTYHHRAAQLVAHLER